MSQPRADKRVGIGERICLFGGGDPQDGEVLPSVSLVGPEANSVPDFSSFNIYEKWLSNKGMRSVAERGCANVPHRALRQACLR
jgi:hypothetical protein